MAKDKRAARKPKGKAPPANVASTAELARLFDCTERQVQLLAEQGIAVRVGHGKYDFAQSTILYVRHLRAQAAGRAGVDPNSDTAAANAERSREQTAWYRVRRLEAERKLIAVEQVRELGGRLMRGIRQFVLGLPNAIAAEVPTLTRHDLAAVKRLCADGLQDASAGHGFDLAGLPTEFDDDVSGGPFGDGAAAGAETPAADPPLRVG
jgi:phage terminase Nu1 subunit (DNA packaging protein)